MAGFTVEQLPQASILESMESEDDFGLGGNEQDAGSEDEAGSSPRTGAKRSFSSAFAEILAHPGSSHGIEAPILLGSKSVSKRMKEAEESESHERSAKMLRSEMRRRGHQAMPKKGADPEHDAREKALLSVALRGAVQLFNAVSKAQRQRKDALAAGAKGKEVKLNKGAFMAELRGGTRAAKEQASGPIPRGTDGASAPGWDVLREDFGRLQGSVSTKMKDWDKQADSDEEVPAQEGRAHFSAGSGDESIGDDDAW